MNLQQICKKYGVSDSVLNSKDDALIVVVQSLKDLQVMENANQPRQSTVGVDGL